MYRFKLKLKLKSIEEATDEEPSGKDINRRRSGKGEQAVCDSVTPPARSDRSVLGTGDIVTHPPLLSFLIRPPPLSFSFSFSSFFHS